MKSMLNGAWQLSFAPQGVNCALTPEDLPALGCQTIAAQVPGNVELDLMRAGVLPDIMTGDAIYAVRPFEGYQWWYQREFPTPDEERVALVFEGIDCLAAVFLNGVCLGEARNMLIAHRFDVSNILRRDGRENELVVRIDSAVLFGRQQQPEACEGASAVNWEALSVRKAPHMYGWDIMPRLVSAGLWRDVYLESLPPTRFTDCYFATTSVDSEAKTAKVVVDWHISTDRFDLDGWQLDVTLDHPDTQTVRNILPVFGTHGRVYWELSEVEFWWPRGTGEQVLYDLSLTLRDATGEVLATHHESIGIRTIHLQYTALTSDAQPGEFVFLVNGEKIFIKGTNWVPLDALHGRDPQHLDATIALAVALNCNMLRCWGGNVYEDHAFFDTCDKNGILVWQDFAFACALYPQTDAFAAEVAREAGTIIRKLRNHPSLALWAGNNEGDQAYEGWFGWSSDPGKDRLSRQVLAEAVRRHDPCREYLPSSPYHSPAWMTRNAVEQFSPEEHLWGPRDDYKGAFYNNSPAHFASEIGYHGCPDRRTLAAMLGEEALSRWPEHESWVTYAMRPLPEFTDNNYRIPLMAKQAALLFGDLPMSLEDFILASQISQAEAVKFFVERFRMGKWRRTGILWWNLRDGWPIISDAVVDYYFRKKLAFNYLQRVQVDVCAMCGEAAQGVHPVVVVNDTLQPVAGELSVRNIDSGEVLWSGTFTVEANARSHVAMLAAEEAPAMWEISWQLAQTSGKNHYLAGPRPFSLATFRGWLARLELDREM